MTIDYHQEENHKLYVHLYEARNLGFKYRPVWTAEKLVDELENYIVRIKDEKQQQQRKYLQRAVQVITDWTKLTDSDKPHVFAFDLSDFSKDEKDPPYNTEKETTEEETGLGGENSLHQNITTNEVTPPADANINIISKSIYRFGHSDTWGCSNCKLYGDRPFMLQHLCKGAK